MTAVYIVQLLMHVLCNQAITLSVLSLQMIGSLRNVLRGRLKANFYVDKWPDYSAVVCQYVWPRRSDVSRQLATDSCVWIPGSRLV